MYEISTYRLEFHVPRNLEILIPLLSVSCLIKFRFSVIKFIDDIPSRKRIFIQDNEVLYPDGVSKDRR